MSFWLPIKAIRISKSQRFRLKFSPMLRFGLLLFLISITCTKLAAQETSGPPALTRVDTGAATSAPDTRYRIGPGDVLTILVRKAPELSGAVRVDQRGMIRIPMIEGELRAACRTESELATHIATLYLEFKQNPNVEVFVSDFQSRPVSVIGSVNAAGQFRLQRQVRLLEILTFAGGPSKASGRVIYVIHTGEPYVCETKPAETREVVGSEGVAMYQLNDTLKGIESANPFVQPGDIIRIPEADQVFVIGHVNAPQAIPLRDKLITVSWAIAMAGGPARDGKTSRIRIIRQAANGEAKQEIFVDLKAIEKRKAEDIALIPNDIVEVGSSPMKTILGMLTGTISPVISSGIVRAIP